MNPNGGTEFPDLDFLPSKYRARNNLPGMTAAQMPIAEH
jgi:hypothetical protein